MDREPTIAEELKTLVDALSVAVQSDFMAREHAKLIWRKLLGASGLDVTQIKKEVNQDGTIKKS